MTPAARRLLVPAVSTLIMLAVLVALGTWQIRRLSWKTGVLAEIAAAEAEPAVPLIGLSSPYAPLPYAKISVTGRFRFDRAVQFGAEVRDTSAGPTMGFYQIVPLDRDGAPTILVNRGWAPQKRSAPLDEPAGEVSVTGYVRPGDTQSWFSAADNVAERRFYTLDPKAIAAAVGITGAAPFILAALGPSKAESFPAPAQHLPRPPNNHLYYVIIWYGLAVALAVIFAIWTRKAL